MFSLRMVLEANDEVFTLHLTRIDNGVVYCRLADAGVQIQREPRHGGMDATGGQPAGTQTLSPGAEEGAEAVPSAAVGVRTATEPPGAPVQDDLAPPPPAIGQAIMASESASPRSTRAPAKAKQRR